MGIVRTAAPTEPVITLDDAKAWLKVETADEDALIQGLIDAFTAWMDGLDGVLGLALGTQEWRLTMDAFPCGEIVLPLGPLVSVDAVTYVDDAGATQTVANGDYTVDLSTMRLAPVESWPATGDVMAAVRIDFTCGHAATGGAAACPDGIKLALKLLLANAYHNREASAPTAMAALPFGVDALIAPHRRPMVTA